MALDFLPGTVQGKSLLYAQALVIVAASVLLAFIVRFLIGRLSAMAAGTESRLDDILLASIRRPLFLLIIAVGVYYAIHILPELQSLIELYDRDFLYRNFILIIFGTWILSVFADAIIKEYGYQMAKRTEGDFDDRLVALLDMSARYIIWVIGILVALGSINVEITPIIAGLGIAGLAIALAAQNLIANIFGGITLSFDRPFRVGDRVKIGDVYGDVDEIRPRFTKIKTLDNVIVTIPNSRLIDTQISNYAYPDTSLRLKLPVGVAYGSDPDKVRKVLADVAGSLPLALKSPPVEIRFTEFAASSLNFETLFWIANYADQYTAADEFNRAVFRRLREEGIEIPFPQMDVHIKKD
ncbi:MAG TPA: mechanosensitive ion channel [Candidatus Methanoperedenaceae archaeon]|nr:mechanosensitive ion channel [Candidatus Methanoperedenaceae archaeon]